MGWYGYLDVKAEALAEYTTACLQQLKVAGVDVGMVQVGNEYATAEWLARTNGIICQNF